MNKTFKQGAPAPGIWIVIATLFAVTTTFAQDKEELKVAKKEKSPFSLDMRWNTHSAYVWRGKVLDKDPTTQPSIIGTADMKDYGALSMKVWSNWDLSPNQKNSKTTSKNGGINVLNFTPSYTKKFGNFAATIGHIWYTFHPRTVNSTRELYTILSYNNSIVTPSLTTYYDYWEVGGRSFLDESPGQNTYSRAALSKSIPLADRLTLNSKALLGFGGSNYNEVRYRSNDGAGLADYEFSTQLMYAVNERLSVGGKMAFTGLVGGAAGLDRDNISPDEIFWGGINVRCVF